MKRLLVLYGKFSALLLALLKPLGFWGIGALAAFDSSLIPVPMDAFIAYYAWHDARHFYLYVLMASIGSAIGGLLPYFLGRAGGEIFMLKRIDRAKYERLRDKFEKQEFVALMIPSMMPPPTPWKLFVFAAGVFEMRIPSFMLSVFTGRLIRFGVESILVIHYGPQIIRDLSGALHHHAVAMLTGLGILLIVLVVWAIRKGKRAGQTA